MKVREVMTDSVIRIRPEESVSVAARLLEHNNIGILPVCGSDGHLKGLVTDRDLVTRCLATGRAPGSTSVGEIMTTRVVSVRPDMETGTAAQLMGSKQVRRLPVVENGRLCGMVGLGDLARFEESAPDVTDAISEITSNISEG